MVAITVAIAATVFVYVSDLGNEQHKTVTPTPVNNTKAFEYGRSLNWSYGINCTHLVVDWCPSCLKAEGNDWYTMPAKWENQCDARYNMDTLVHFNAKTGEHYAEWKM